MPQESEIREALKQVVDAEVGVNIVDLGLVYKVESVADEVRVSMTMTTRTCPLGEQIKADAERAVRSRFPGLKTVEIKLVFDPPWKPAMMSNAAKKRLGTG